MKKLLTLLAFGVVFLNGVAAQNGKYIVSASFAGMNCENNKASIDILVKATDENSTFMLADQNYRFSFSRAALRPGSASLEKELDISGMTQSETGMNFFSSHTLNGTGDTLVSYSIELLSGDGYPVVHDKWTPIGRLQFDVANINECFSIKWHDTEIFPPTHITEQWDGLPYVMSGGEYDGFDICFTDYCEADLPTSIENVTAASNQIEIKPTVTSHTLNVAYTGSKNLSTSELIITDMSGNLVQSNRNFLNNNNEFESDVSMLPQGVYVISITVDRQWVSQKFVKI